MFTSTNLVFLMALDEGLSTGYILGQFVGRNDRLHVVDPGGEISEVSEEAVQTIALVQALASLLGLAGESLPVCHDLGALGLYLVRVVRVYPTQSVCLLA